MNDEDLSEFSLLDFSEKPEISRKQVLIDLPSGEIRTETGSDGVYLVFDADCVDCLPYCKAQCCGLIGTCLSPGEAESGNYEAYWDEALSSFVVKRDADGFCTYLDRRTRLCRVHHDKPHTCSSFHCSRGANMRGWKLANGVHRLPAA